ncbi:hypothetical protein QVD17_02898 [Tagetes erecta]|uniref:Transmembrane protein n=1 Tax=Tagetes erecta TaxID=13708 RepID=A0AAD8LA02_TARER|nr:hypothetical protein QVD17_02898 [Tagetes erecta]
MIVMMQGNTSYFAGLWDATDDTHDFESSKQMDNGSFCKVHVYLSIYTTHHTRLILQSFQFAIFLALFLHPLFFLPISSINHQKTTKIRF